MARRSRTSAPMRSKQKRILKIKTPNYEWASEKENQSTTLTHMMARCTIISHQRAQSKHKKLTKCDPKQTIPHNRTQGPWKRMQISQGGT